MNPANEIMSMLQNEIGQWEHAINSYTGQDPLDLWFSYVCWLESNLSSYQVLESKFRKSVEHCLSMYDKYENYKQDLRMVKLWIKYIDFQPNPLNLYKILYQQGVGTKVAAFYIGWAHYYNSANHFKQAESIYNLGIQLKAEPLYELETAQKNFRFSVAQRMLYNDESSKKRTISSLEEQRQQITSLSPHQNQISAKRMRTDSYSQDQYSGQQATSSNAMPNTTNVNVQQYPDYNNYSNDPAYAISSSLNYVYDNSNVYPPTSEEQAQQQAQQPTNFTFECGFQIPQNFINFSRNSHEQWNAPLCLEEPYDQNRRCFYPKHLVYPGDGREYSLEELKGHKWRLRMEEKRRQEELRIQHENDEKIRQEQERARLEQERIRQERIKQEQEKARQEQERIRLEQERVRQEQDRLRQEAEARRLREEQIRKEQEAQQHMKAEQEAQRQREAYQMQQQQRWNYHHSPANYANAYYHQNYQNSPQYSYAHDHQYQTHYAAYQQSPQSYSNSPNYHQQTVMHQQYYMNYQAQHTMNYQMQPPPQHHLAQPQIQHPYSQPTPPQNQNTPLTNIQQQPTQNVSQKPNFQDSDYQDVEYLIDHQAEIDPNMLQQPIVENESHENSSQDEYEGSESEEIEEEAEQIPTIVTSYMLDDLEEQIEASTISFSSNGKSRDKKITIKFRKEKTTTIINSESNSNSSITNAKIKEVPLEPSSTSSSISSAKKKQVKKEIVRSYDGENTQFMPSATNSCSSTQNGDNQKHSFSKINFNGCITPIKKPPASKTSTPISSYKFLKNQSSFSSNINDDSRSSFCGDQNSFFQADNDDDFKNRRMEKALATIDDHMKKRDIDPFHSELCRAFLVKLNFPNRENTSDYLVTSTNLPKIIKNQIVPISDATYQIEKEVGRGSYGAVYRGINTTDGTVVALKYQRPSNMATWELYICTEVKKRIKSADILPGFMTITAAVIAPNASVLISEFSQYGSLLDINNRVRQATTKVMHESLVMHFTSQIFNIVAHLHDCKIIHADIKPDNFLLMTLPSMDTHIPSLRLIDFGCAIDMTLFKEGQEFRKIIETDGFTCVEMREARLWSYQTDLFCIAGTIHVMLFGEYMQVNKKFGVWDIKQKFPRYLNKTLWTDVFSKLLNIKDSKSLPSLKQLKANVDREINENELSRNIRTVSNLIRKR
ncbi:hypothetical protein ACKWTF_008376 [Chironomus riparius]